VGEAAVEVVLVGPVLQVADPQSAYLLQVRRLVVRRCHLAARRRGAARGPEARRTWVRSGRSSPAAASRSFSASRNLVRFSFSVLKNNFACLWAFWIHFGFWPLYSLHGRGAVRGGVTARGQHSIRAHMQNNMYLVMSLGHSHRRS
jgi:hypothetical protein